MRARAGARSLLVAFTPMTESTPNKPRPPESATLTRVLIALTAFVVGNVLQELRWRNSANSSETGLEYAERAFQNGDNRTALELFVKPANQNNPNAEYWLGHMFEIGLGVPRDATKAVDFYKKAADQNVVAAEARLGDIYLSGDQLPRFRSGEVSSGSRCVSRGSQVGDAVGTNVPGRPWNSEGSNAGLCMV
jgi:TPR repeat protein